MWHMKTQPGNVSQHILQDGRKKPDAKPCKKRSYWQLYGHWTPLNNPDVMYDFWGIPTSRHTASGPCVQEQYV